MSASGSSASTSHAVVHEPRTTFGSNTSRGMIPFPSVPGEGSVENEGERHEPKRTTKGTARKRSAADVLVELTRQATVQAARQASHANGSRTQVGFVQKLFSMLGDEALSPYITWKKGGTVFCVVDPTAFAQDVLPNVFKHSNFQSFVRQLNMYSFHKYVSVNDQPSGSSESATSSWEFHHPSFRRDRPDLLSSVLRKASKGTPRHVSQPEPTTSPPSSRSSSVHSDEEPSSSTPTTVSNRERSPVDLKSHFMDSPLMMDEPSWRVGLQPPTLPSHDYAPSRATQMPTPPPTGNADDDLYNRVTRLSENVRQLTEEIIRSRQSAAEDRKSTTSILWMLLNLVASADISGEHRRDIDLAHAALSRMNCTPSQEYLPRETRHQSSSVFYHGVPPPRPSPTHAGHPSGPASPSWSHLSHAQEQPHRPSWVADGQSSRTFPISIGPYPRAAPSTLPSSVTVGQSRPPSAMASSKTGSERLPSFKSLFSLAGDAERTGPMEDWSGFEPDAKRVRRY